MASHKAGQLYTEGRLIGLLQAVSSRGFLLFVQVLYAWTTVKLATILMTNSDVYTEFNMTSSH